MSGFAEIGAEHHTREMREFSSRMRWTHGFDTAFVEVKFTGAVLFVAYRPGVSKRKRARMIRATVDAHLCEVLEAAPVTSRAQ